MLSRVARRGIAFAESTRFSEDQAAMYGIQIIQILDFALAESNVETPNSPPYPAFDDAYSAAKLIDYLKWQESNLARRQH